MQVARLHGPKDIRIADEPPPPPPGRGEVTLSITTVGLCGSDLHMYEAGQIGYTSISKPAVLGHEFIGEVAAIGKDALDGAHQPLQLGQRVAVEPHVPCWRCELCEHGHPNLCPNHFFYGTIPRRWRPARTHERQRAQFVSRFQIQSAMRLDPCWKRSASPSMQST